MAKALRTAALVVGAVALAATGAGALASAGLIGTAAAAGAAASTATVFGVTAATLTTVGTIASVAASVAGIAAGLMAKKPAGSGSGSQTEFSADPRAGVPYLMGRTGTKGNIVFRQAADGWALKDTPNDLCDLVTVLSGAGPIDGYESFTSDKAAINFDGAGNAIGEFRDKMFQRTQLGACPEPAALTVQAGSSSRPNGWTAAHRLSGMAAVIWRLRYDSKQRFFQNGVPTPMWVVRGVKVYDPRKDSTYPGGSGAHRAGDEATWEWSANPYLHALTWVIGRHQNGKRVMGLGAPIDQIIVSDFVEGANISDANGWTVGGVVYSRPDTKWNVLKQILQAGAGEPLRVGARIGCLINTPRVSLSTITVADIIGDAKLTAMQPIRNRLNTVTPRYRSEANDWEIVPAAPIAVPAHIAEDGDERSKEIEYSLVQDVAQAACLARYDIENTREFGPVTMPLKPKWLNYKAGDCITLEVPEASGQKMLILKRTIDPSTAIVTFEMRSETDAKHPFALGQTTTPPPTATVRPADPPVPPPSPDSWSAAALQVSDGIVTPTILVSGFVSNGSVDAVVFEYRVYDPNALPEAGWTGANLEAASVTRTEITALLPATQYEVGVRYRARGVIGGRLVLGPVSTADVSGETGSGSWTHIANTAATIVTPTSLRSTGAQGWGSGASQSRESYARGASASFTLPTPAVGAGVFAGLTAHPESTLSYERISFSLYRDQSGYMDIRIDGNVYTQVSAPTPDQPAYCRVEFDGVDTIRWYVNGSFRTTYYWPYPDTPLYFATSISGTTVGVTEIGFTAIGARGRNGSDGAPGAPGADGRTQYTHYAYANSPDGVVDFAVGAPAGRAYVGTYVDFTAADSTNPASYTWTAYKGPAAFGLAARGDVVVASNALVKTGSGTWGTGGGYSTEGWKGGAQASFKLPSPSTFAGLNTDPTTDDAYASMDYAFHCSEDGNTYIFENGSAIVTLTGGNVFTRTFQIIYDNAFVRYYVDGVLILERAASAGLTLYFDASIATAAGYKITDINFIAAGTAGAAAIDVSLAASLAAAPFNAANAYTGGDIVFTATRKNTAETPVFTIKSSDGTTHGNGARTAAQHAADYPNSFATTGVDVLIVKPAQIISMLSGAFGTSFNVAVAAAIGRGQASVARVTDGAAGQPGAPGAPGQNAGAVTVRGAKTDILELFINEGQTVYIDVETAVRLYRGGTGAVSLEVYARAKGASNWTGPIVAGSNVGEYNQPLDVSATGTWAPSAPDTYEFMAEGGAFGAGMSLNSMTISTDGFA